MAGTTTWFTYDEFGQAKKTESENLCVVRTLDNLGRLSRYETSADETDIYVVNNLSYASETDDTVVSEQVQYVSEYTQGDNLTTLATTYAKDNLQRPTSTTVMQGNFGFRYNYSYVPRRTRTWVSGNGQVAFALPPIRDGHWDISDVGTTQYVSQFKQYNVSENEETLVATDNLEYDANGNITKYSNVTYKYDKFNRLVRENNPTLDKTTTWCYDVSGNVCSRTEYSYTTGTVGTPVATFNYTYGNGWKDQLTAYNGQSITYDQAGNPTSYLGKTLGWTRGRLLASYNSVSMQYDANGVRTRKVVPATNGSDSETVTYLYNGANLVCEKVELANTTDYKYFLYNSQGVVGFVQNGTTYMYRKNFFGDVTAIYRGATKVAEYAYDAWGNCTIVSDTNGIGTANPFRYRSYYWDNDLQLYYLMSRYYDPQIGRFLNADGLEYLDPETLGGLNLYAYCNNNPVMHSDSFGTDWNNTWWRKLLIGIGIIVIAVVFAVAVAASAGTVAAIAGTVAATIGASAATVTTVSTVASIATTAVAVGITAFCVSDAIEVWSGGVNPIRDWTMAGDQSLYDNTKTGFNIAGSVATLIGSVAPSLIRGLHPQVNFGGRNTPLKGQLPFSQLVTNRSDGYQVNFYDSNGVWSLRWDIYSQSGHSNPHIHYETPSSKGNMLGIWWWIKELLRR